MTEGAKPRVGFIGLGSQGGPMAERIVQAGYATSLWARRAETLAPFGATDAVIVATPAQLAERSDVLCICVVDDGGVDEVLRGPDGALTALADDSVVVIHSTVHPGTCLRLQSDYPNVQVLDAPVSGGGHMATARELLVMIGGSVDVVERCRPIFETFGNPVLHLGPLGSGQEAKILNNTVFAAQLALACEVFALAADRDLDQASLATVLSRGSGRSYAAEVIAGSGYDLERLSPLAGPLLAKDFGILLDFIGPRESLFIEAAREALVRMNVSPPDR